MTKPSLPNVTLVCADCIDTARAIRVLEHCRNLCDFGAVKLLTSLETDYRDAVKIVHLGSLNDYSAFCLKELHKYILTPFMLTVQHDGWIVNPEAWDQSWCDYDYIGPLYLQETHVNLWSVGSGGFSFRSTRFMAAVARVLPPWDGSASYDNPSDGKNYWSHEDGVVTKHLRHYLEGAGFHYAPPLVAGRFAYGGNPNMQYYCPKPFGFHGFYACDRLAGGPGDGHSPYLTPDELRYKLDIQCTTENK